MNAILKPMNGNPKRLKAGNLIAWAENG